MPAKKSAKKISNTKKKTSVSKKKKKELSVTSELETVQPNEISEVEEFDPREKYMSIWEHLEEFRIVLLKSLSFLAVCMGVTLFFSSDLYKVMVVPYKNVLGADAKFFQIKLMAPLVIYLKMSFLISLLITLPVILYLVWGFISPAVSEATEKYGRLIIGFSTFLFWAGIFVCWFTVFENLLKVFLVYYNPPDVENRLPVDEYFDIFFNFHIIFGLSFQLPVVLILLGKLGIISGRFLAEKWREATIIISIFSAVFSPGPDVTFMLMLFVPLEILFLISVFIMKVSEKNRDPGGV